jgi:hypothetical protein
MKIGRYALLGVGVAIGFVLGTREGRERYEQMTHWARRTSDDLGVGDAVGRVVGTAQDTAMDLRDTATSRAHDALQAGSESVSESVKSAGEAIKPDA